ncbi:ABC transporter permease subunit [Guggenheimella bovis]
MSLFRNETIKLFSRKKNFIVILLFLLLCTLATYVTYKESEWIERQYDKQTAIDMLHEQMMSEEYYYKEAGADMTPAEKQAHDETMKTLNEKIEKLKTFSQEEVRLSVLNDHWEQVASSMDLEKFPEYKEIYEHNKAQKIIPEFEREFSSVAFLRTLWAMFTVFLLIGLALFGADFFSGEMNPPTFKHLLVQPVSRRGVFFSKWFTFTFWTLVMIFGIEALFFLGIGFTKGFGSLDALVRVDTAFKVIKHADGSWSPELIAGSGRTVTLLRYMLETLGIQALVITACTSLITFFSVLVKNPLVSSTLPIGIAIFSAIFGNLLGYKPFQIFNFLNYQNPLQILGRDLNGFGFWGGASDGIQATFPLAAIVLVGTSLLFIVLSSIIFKRRDILS